MRHSPAQPPLGAQPFDTEASPTTIATEEGQGAKRDLSSLEYWNARAASFGSSCGTSPYASAFIAQLPLDEGDTVLDMGCAAGTLALPLARAGHTVYGCDFSPRMLERLKQGADAEDLPIKPTLMSWEDDWSSFGFEEDSVDVAVASRSLMLSSLAEALDKLDRTARKAAAVTVSGGLVPLMDPRLMEYLGRDVPTAHAHADVVTHLVARSRYPHLSYIPTKRPMRFTEWDFALLELEKLAGRKPLDKQERTRFEAYAKNHFRVEKQGGTEVYQLDYPLTCPWALITWSTKGDL